MLDKLLSNKQWHHSANIPAINIDLQGSFDIEIYTDGSKDGANVGCAFVAFEAGSVVAEEKYRLDQHCSNNQAELIAIAKALEWLDENLSRSKSIRIAIVSPISLDTIGNPYIHFQLEVDIGRFSLLELQQRCRLSFSWVKPHVGIESNEKADMLVKSASVDRTIPSSYSKLSLMVLKGWIEQQSLQEWEQLWNVSPTGRLTKEFIPPISGRIKMK